MYLGISITLPFYPNFTPLQFSVPSKTIKCTNTIDSFQTHNQWQWLSTTLTTHLTSNRTPSRRKIWSNKQTTRLWKLYADNLIDPNNNNADYLWDKSQQYFPDFISTGPECKKSAVRRLQDKIVLRQNQLTLEGVHAGAIGECARHTCLTCLYFLSTYTYYINSK